MSEDKKSLNNYEYISELIEAVKNANKNKRQADWEFSELEKLYQPILRGQAKILIRWYKKFIPVEEAYGLVLQAFWRVICRYQPTFTDREGNKSDFKIYFSKYCPGALRWEIHRMIHPSREEYAEYGYDAKKQDLEHLPDEVLIDPPPENENPFPVVTENFIRLCWMVSERTKSDQIADCFFLRYGMDMSNSEIAKCLAISGTKVCNNLETANNLAKENIKSYISEEALKKAGIESEDDE